MEGPRAPKGSELADVISFLDRYLRPQHSWSIQEEYPNSLGISNQPNIRVITDNDEVVSHAVMKQLIIKTKVGLFRAAAIGSVVTHPNYRQKGLSGQILESCLEAAKAQGCDFAILWTDLYDFYRKMDFELAGAEVSFLIDRDLGELPKGIRVVEGSKVAPEAILKIYNDHTVTSLRNVNDIRDFMKIPESRIYTAWNKQNQIVAYAVEGKGADLQGYLHEWGGSVSNLLPLISHIRQQQGRDLTLIVPGHSENLIRNLRSLGLSPIFGHLGMIKILSTENLFIKIKRYARSLGIEDLVLHQEGGQYYLGQGDNILGTTKLANLTQLVFGPLKPTHIDSFKLETVRTLDRVLPIPMWIWGWDSV